MRSLLKFLAISLVACCLVLAGLIFIPRSYNVPSFKPNASVHYWNLPTGSKIGYFHLPAVNSPKAYPIIYLHGGPGGSISEEHLVDLKTFTKWGFDVYAYDQIGSGHSARLDDITAYTVERHKEDLHAIIQKIGTEKVILLAQSWGSCLATAFLAKYKHKVHQLIVTGPGPILPIQKRLKEIQAPDSLALRLPIFSNAQGNQAAASMRTKVMDWVAYTQGKKLASDAEADQYFAYLNSFLNRSGLCDTSKISASGGGLGYYAHIMTVKSFRQVKDVRAQLKSVSVPILWLRGQCDNQPWGFAAEYLSLFPQIEWQIIPDAGHFIEEEQPALYYKAIQDFIAPMSIQDSSTLRLSK